MRLFRSFAKPDADEGEWEVFRTEGDDDVALKDPDKLPAFRIRRMPDELGRNLEREVLGQKTRVLLKGAEVAVDTEGVRQAEVNLRKASWCLLDSRNVEHAVGDQAAAEEWARYIGAPVVVGQDFDLSGKWTPEVKRAYFKDYSEVVGWILSRSRRKAKVHREEEEGKGET